MAGTLQTLILAPQPTKTPSFHHRSLHFPSNRSVLSRSTSFNHGHSISRSIRASHPSDQVSGSSNIFNWTKPLSKFVANNFLPLALVGGVTLGFANPSLGCLADKYHVSKVSPFVIFIISGLTLRSQEIGAAAEAWPVGIFGLCSILLFTPCFSKLILQVHLQPQEFVTGLAIFNCMPTTLSSGVALTSLAGGNSALALAMTVISNLLGILIVPFSISRFIASGVGVSVPTEQLFRSLVLTLLIPLILGKILRESFKGLAKFVDHNRKLFSQISAIFLSLVPWIQVSRSRSLLLMVKPKVFLLAIGMGILLHLILLAFNAIAVRSLSAVSGGSQSAFAKKENVSAFVLVASQKTLPVMVAVVEQLGGAFGKSGLLVLPCVAAHLIQIIMDSFLVNSWPREDISSNNVKIA
ncbi:probable sodium/metabolite cotransporter BASS4, chloroplastic [Mangifera indica]|uniref:probable sodium/metabolite cotransporter BASS4, chloroplastic n=1 Tax=Mangifera indica TaxID=29780 RepID=UPI001CFA4676|nr:probable sodium/metabolite cotransporter BASS4, chloroplastic [Mangifera indica]XP_044462292.1 probable sodium/metabolite cotransporter BASS4, chloroplastic [Mangifera indica]